MKRWEQFDGLRSNSREILKRVLVVLVLLLSLGDYGLRAYRLVAAPGITDFQDPYIGAQLWGHGENPYDRETVREAWRKATGLVPISEIKTVYPVTTYFLLSPFGLFRYQTALFLWLTVQLSSVFAIGVLIWHRRWFGNSVLTTVALVSAYTPFHTALHGANCGPLCMALALAACLVRSEKAAGIILAVSICIKPQIAIWFVILWVVQRKWAAFFTCIAAGVLITLISLMPYVSRLPELASAYQNQYRHGFEQGASGDYAGDRSDRLSMVNLQPAVYQLSRSQAVANTTAVLAFSILGGFWFYAGRHSEDELLLLVSLVAISILPIYRRTNDLGLFVLPLFWGIRNRSHWAGLFVAACAAMFFIPMNSILARLEIYGLLSGIQSWLVLAMAAVSIYALWKSRAFTRQLQLGN
jgi:hypothetical protein